MACPYCSPECLCVRPVLACARSLSLYVTSVHTSLSLATDHWQKEKLKPVRSQTKVGCRSAWWLWCSPCVCTSGLRPHVCLCLLFLSSSYHEWFFDEPRFSLSLHFFSIFCILLLQFKYLMRALPLVTMHYFSALLRAHWLLSLPSTPPGPRPDTDTISDAAIVHPSQLFCPFSHTTWMKWIFQCAITGAVHGPVRPQQLNWGCKWPENPTSVIKQPWISIQPSFPFRCSVQFSVGMV